MTGWYAATARWSQAVNGAYVLCAEAFRGNLNMAQEARRLAKKVTQKHERGTVGYAEPKEIWTHVGNVTVARWYAVTVK